VDIQVSYAIFARHLKLSSCVLKLRAVPRKYSAVFRFYLPSKYQKKMAVSEKVTHTYSCLLHVTVYHCYKFDFSFFRKMQCIMMFFHCVRVNDEHYFFIFHSLLTC